MGTQVLDRVRRRSAGAAIGLHLPGLQRLADDGDTTRTFAAGWGTRGRRIPCSRRATTRSRARCGSRCAACRRRRNSPGELADNVGPGGCNSRTPRRPTKPTARCRPRLTAHRRRPPKRVSAVAVTRADIAGRSEARWTVHRAHRDRTSRRHHLPVAARHHRQGRAGRSLARSSSTSASCPSPRSRRGRCSPAPVGMSSAGPTCRSCWSRAHRGQNAVDPQRRHPLCPRVSDCRTGL